MTISRSDVGCWVVKGDPQNAWDYFAALSGGTAATMPAFVPSNWSVGKTYRNGLMRKGDRVALLMTGTRNPGLYEFGRITSDGVQSWPHGWNPTYAIDHHRASQPCSGIEYDAIQLGLHSFIPRTVFKADPIIRASEPFRAPRMSNPTYFTVQETQQLSQLMTQHLSPKLLKKVKWV